MRHVIVGLAVGWISTVAAAQAPSTNDLADACASCHEVYRDKGPADSAARCTPPPRK